MDFEDEDVDGLDTMGDSSFDVVGAAVAKALKLNPKALASAARRGRSRPATPSWASHLSGQGISRVAEEMDYLPMTIKNITLAAPAGEARAFPQRPFRGERIIAFATLADSAAPGVFSDASQFVVISPAISVGAVQVGAASGDAPLAAFANNSFGVRLSLPPTGQGSQIYIPMRSIVTLTATQTIQLSITIIGRAVR